MTYLSFLNKLFLIFCLTVFTTSLALAQIDYSKFCEQSYGIQNNGMIILGSWAILNIGTGLYGWNHYSNQQKYFYQMNFFWNVVNLSIAGIALYNNSQINCSALAPDNILSEHKQIENILLINSALDVGYIGIGFLLKHYSNRSVEKSNLLKGYGNSLILQGAFLLVFDLILYAILRDHRVDFIQTLNFSITNDINMYRITFRL